MHNIPAQETAKHHAKFRWLPLSDVTAVTKPRRETCYNLLGCPKLTNRSQPLLGRSSPHCQNIWGRYCCLTSSFPIVDTYLLLRRYSPTICAMVRRWRIFGNFCVLYFSQPRIQHVSDLHPKFALRPQHVYKYGRHPNCNG